MEKHAKTYVYGSLLLIVILVGLLFYGYNNLTKLKDAYTARGTELEATKETLSTEKERASNLEAIIEIIKQEFALSEENGSELLGLLKAEKERNQEFEDQITGISGTVGLLDKLSKTDPQLLQKYSKIYFLNENYMPGVVLEIPKEFRRDGNTSLFIHEKVAPFLTDLLKRADRDGISLLVASAYRSFDEQGSLKNGYSVQYGTGANSFSADQGYSEHQLGTTIDFTTTEINGTLYDFETTKAYAWLLKNAYRYGFALSYPKDNTYYVFEPWHWRFVGTDLARDLNRDNKYFYDLSQREIDAYLISLFD
ncbi:MAG: M15 family metallopeptidase [Candidatus Pacebacteria bacterium]|nr:M15 family metallopeptidase [Candidatus Paceibacterota bacterium]MCF7856879.1 M15 family metallopeptidase [Candidatus Paceibacterota bacterium]